VSSATRWSENSDEQIASSEGSKPAGPIDSRQISTWAMDVTLRDQKSQAAQATWPNKKPKANRFGLQ